METAIAIDGTVIDFHGPDSVRQYVLTLLSKSHRMIFFYQKVEVDHIVQIKRLGYEKKIAGEIRDCHENALSKSFEMNSHMIKLALSLKILMAPA